MVHHVYTMDTRYQCCEVRHEVLNGGKQLFDPTDVFASMHRWNRALSVYTRCTAWRWQRSNQKNAYPPNNTETPVTTFFTCSLWTYWMTKKNRIFFFTRDERHPGRHVHNKNTVGRNNGEHLLPRYIAQSAEVWRPIMVPESLISPSSACKGFQGVIGSYDYSKVSVFDTSKRT